jgi:outer membrane receptor protein involved in Fe transport
MALRRLLLLLLAGCLCLTLNSPALSQTNAGLRGTILDKDGAPIPGATVTVTNASLGVSQGAVTDAKGEFRIVPLPPGKGYSLKVSFPGMATVTLSDIDVAGGRLTTVPVTLRPEAEMKERVRVVGSTDVVNTESTTTQTTISAEFIEALPILGTDYQDALTLAPGVTDVDGDGNPNIHGSRDTDVVTLVDGVSTVDPLTGQGGQELNIESIQEIEIKTAGATAEYGRAQGGFVNVITKSGGNEFEGSFKFQWRSNVFDGDGAGIDNPQLHGGLGELGLRDLKFNDLYPFVSVSGPIRKDKAWYFFTAEYIQIEDPVNASTQAFVRGFEEQRVFGKATWEMSTNHKLVFTATLDPQEFSNFGIDSFTALESGYTVQLGGLNLLLSETSVLSPNVFLETKLQHFTSRPALIPTLDADTNGNGVLFIDRNNNHFLEAPERDPGVDWDRDGVYDVSEDRPKKNGRLDPGEDRDGDGRLTKDGVGCESEFREDIDCDGRLDLVNEDGNGNGILDQGEDIDRDNRLDLGNEDRNYNQNLDDRPRPQRDDVIYQCQPGVTPCVPVSQLPASYPYPTFTPTPRDRDYEIDQRTLRTSGPYPEEEDREVGRITLKQDLTVFVPDWHGQHDMKFGGVVEREHYTQDTTRRPTLRPNDDPPGGNQILPTISVSLPAEREVSNEATSTTFGMYATDTYKPLPNLTLVLGVRFEREATDSFGYTPTDPAGQRRLFDRILQLGIRKEGADEQIGNNDGIASEGFCSDPLFGELDCRNNASHPLIRSDPLAGTVGLDTLNRIATTRLFQHHYATDLTAESLRSLFPDVIDQSTGEIDVKKLRSVGYATFIERESFRLTNNNLAPRFSISWDPWADSKTKVFAAWGRFYDKLFLNAVVPEEGPDDILRFYRTDSSGVSASGVPNNGIGPPVTKAPPNASQVDRGLQTPFSDELSIGFERELAPEVSFKMTYFNKKYRQQLQDRDINHSVRFGPDGKMQDLNGRLVAVDSGSATRLPDGRPDLYIHNFFFNQIFRLRNMNEARYKGVELQVTKRLSRKWQMDASYTYSRAQGDAEDFLSPLGDDPAVASTEYGYLDFDQRHVVKFSGVSYLPRDWQVGGTLVWQSGLPYSVISTFVSSDNYDYQQIRFLFGYTPDQPDADGRRLFQPQNRNSGRNDAYYNIGLSARKAFVLGRLNSKLHLTVDNLLNTDDQRIFFYEPANPNRSGALQLDSERRFGRRFQIGFEFEF